MKPLAAILVKDIAVEMRKKEAFSSMLLFGLLVVVTSSFAFASDSSGAETISAGILWIAFSFAGILGLNRSLSMETDNDCLQGLLLAPVSRGDIYLGKVASNLAFTMTAQLFILPVFIVVNNLRFDFRIVSVIGIAALGTLAFVAVGTTLSMISAQTAMREVMLPILQIPMTLPVVIVSVEATSMILRQETEGISFPLSLLGVFSTVYLTASYFVIEYIVEE